MKVAAIAKEDDRIAADQAATRAQISATFAAATVASAAGTAALYVDKITAYDTALAKAALVAAAAAKRIADVDAAVARRLSVWNAAAHRRTAVLAAAVARRLFHTISDTYARQAGRDDAMDAGDCGTA